jgi:hypothetical protein
MRRNINRNAARRELARAGFQAFRGHAPLGGKIGELSLGIKVLTSSVKFLVRVEIK